METTVALRMVLDHLSEIMFGLVIIGSVVLAFAVRSRRG